MKRLLLIFTFTLLISCQEKNPPAEVEMSEGRRTFADQLESDQRRIVSLTPEAREQVNQWLAYATAQNEIETLKTATGTEIIAGSRSLVQIMESLQSTMPEVLKSPAVEARVNVLVTKSKVLHQLSNKKDKNADEIFDVANDVIEEFDNFKMQINELFLKTPGDFELDLDEEFEQSRSGDSIPDDPFDFD